MGLWRRLRIRCQELGNGTQFSAQGEHILSHCITGIVHGFSHVKSCHPIVPFPCVNFCSFVVCEHGCNASAAESPRLDDRMGKLEARRPEAASSHPFLSFTCLAGGTNRTTAASLVFLKVEVVEDLRLKNKSSRRDRTPGARPQPSAGSVGSVVPVVQESIFFRILVFGL